MKYITLALSLGLALSTPALAASKRAPSGVRLFSLSVSRSRPNESTQLKEGRGELSGRALPFKAAVANIWGVRADQVLVATGSVLVPKFDFELYAPRRGFDAGLKSLRTAVSEVFGFHVERIRRVAGAYELRLASSRSRRPDSAAPGSKAGLANYGGRRLIGTADMDEAAAALSTSVGAQVFNETGLVGKYRFDLRWKLGDEASVARALAGQGLTLVPVRRKVDFLRVTSAKR